MNIKDRVVYAVNKIHVLYLYIITFAFIVLIVWFWKQAVYEPLELKERQYFTTIEALEQKKLVLPDLRYTIVSLRNKNESLKNDFQSRLLRYSASDPYLQLERILIDLDEVGLEVAAFTPEGAKKKTFYERDVMNFKVRGDFEKIIDFLRLFDTRNMLAKFKKSIISQDDEGLVLDSTVALYSVGKE